MQLSLLLLILIVVTSGSYGRYSPQNYHRRGKLLPIFENKGTLSRIQEFFLRG